MIEARDFDLQWEGRRCIVKGLGADKSMQVARRLANMIGEGMKVGGERSVIVGAGAVLSGITDEQMKWFVDTFEAITDIEREPGSEDWCGIREVRDLVFGGSEGLMRRFRWLQFCLETCCGDFLADLRQKFVAGLMMMKAMQVAASPSTSEKPGSVTESHSASSTPTVS